MAVIIKNIDLNNIATLKIKQQFFILQTTHKYHSKIFAAISRNCQKFPILHFNHNSQSIFQSRFTIQLPISTFDNN